MGIVDTIKGKVNQLDKTYNPFRQVGDAISVGTPVKTEPLTPLPANPAKTAREAAINSGKTAYDEAVARGKGQ